MKWARQSRQANKNKIKEQCPGTDIERVQTEQTVIGISEFPRCKVIARPKEKRKESATTRPSPPTYLSNLRCDFSRSTPFYWLTSDRPDPPVNQQDGPRHVPATGHNVPSGHGPVQVDNAMRGPQVLPRCLWVSLNGDWGYLGLIWVQTWPTATRIGPRTWNCIAGHTNGFWSRWTVRISLLVAFI